MLQIELEVIINILLLLTCQSLSNRFEMLKEEVDILDFYVGGVFYSTTTNAPAAPNIYIYIF
jgi:hypothetical protein